MRRSLLLLMLAACAQAHHDRSPDQRLLYDRPWLDHEPRDPKDVIQAFILSERKVGVFAAQNMWKGGFEVFRYTRRADGTFDLLFPDNDDKQRLTVTAWRCDERGYDYCLELSGTNRGVRRYVSKKEWKRRDDEDAEAAITRVISGGR